MSPRAAIVYWSEYVIRHRGAVHLRSAAMDLNFVQYHNIDVLAILVVSLLLTLCVLCWVLRLVFRTFLAKISLRKPIKKEQ